MHYANKPEKPSLGEGSRSLTRSLFLFWKNRARSFEFGAISTTDQSRRQDVFSPRRDFSRHRAMKSLVIAPRSRRVIDVLANYADLIAVWSINRSSFGTIARDRNFVQSNCARVNNRSAEQRVKDDERANASPADEKMTE